MVRDSILFWSLQQQLSKAFSFTLTVLRNLSVYTLWIFNWICCCDVIDPNVGSCCWWWCFVLLDTTQPKSSSIHRPRIYTHNHFTTNMSHFYLTGEVGEDAFRFRSVHPSVAIPSLFPSTIKRKTKNHDMFHTNVLYFSKRNGTTSFLLYIHKLGFQRRIFYSTL